MIVQNLIHAVGTSSRSMVLLLLAAALCAANANANDVLYRVNAGGPEVAAIDGGPNWSADTPGVPSVYLAAGGGQTGLHTPLSIEAGVPASTPDAIFNSERWDLLEAPEMLWQFPVADGTPVEIRLYLMNGWAGTAQPGQRVFDVQIDGVTAFNGIDLSGEAGHLVGTVRSYQTVSDGLIDIEFIHAVENPLVNGFEIVAMGPQPGVLSSSPPGVAFGSVSMASPVTETITLKNLGELGDPDIEITSVSLGGDFSTTLSTGLTLVPGAEVTADVTFSPQSAGQQTGMLSISHNGNNSPLDVNLSGEGFDPSVSPISFSSQTIAYLNNPTQMEFGPDGRLYVSELKGLIYAFEIDRDEGTGNYSVLDVEVIGLIQTIPNHNDDGSPNPSSQRNVTGMITAGTPANPVLYITSSDPRIDDPTADSNSGMLSRLTWTGTEWEKLDLVRSLPRSAHDHLPNGLALDEDTGMLYIAMGGHTNMGAPSFSFGYLPEYAYSGSVVSVDLNIIGNSTYDIPTLQGPVFGGQFGANQAMLVPGGPVQVHSPGYRNPYDVIVTSSGKLYTWDNGPNSGWGGLPIDEGPAGNCTNGSNESGSATYPDALHYIDAPGYYGGHPNPTRANRDNTFAGLTPIPVGMENPVECDYLAPGITNAALTTNGASTNGLAEYTASNFGGIMTGNILATSWNGNVLRVKLNSAGNEVVQQENLFTGLSGPLGLTALSDTGPFPGTIWISQYFGGNITVFEPQDFTECHPSTLDPNDTSPNGYTYGDLIANGLDPCNPAQIPPDFDQDFVSDISDNDIDGDGILNQDDLFDFDPGNGRSTGLPHRIAWTNDVVGAQGGMTAWSAPGFTGHMMHPTATLSIFDQFDPDLLIPGGAAGIFTVEAVSTGEAFQTMNTQENAFHFGVDVGPATGIFTVRSQIRTPFAGFTPQNYQSMGVSIGNGDQDNFIKLVTNANDGAGGLEFAVEIDAVFAGQQISAPILGSDYVDLYLEIDPAALTVTASYVITTEGVRGSREPAGTPVAIPEAWLTDLTNGLAAGIISTASNAIPFPASWRFVEVYAGNGEFFPDPNLAGALSAQPAALDFQSVPIGSESTLNVNLVNQGSLGDVDISVTTITVAGDTVFTTDFPGSLVMAPGESESLAVTFAPDAPGGFVADLVIEHDGVDSPLMVSVTGTGTGTVAAPALAAAPAAVDFGQVTFQQTASQSVTLTNVGDADLLFGELGLSGGDATQFNIALDGCSNQTLAPTLSCEVQVALTPAITGLFTAQLDLPSDATEGPDLVPLSGEGVPAEAIVTLGGLIQVYDGDPKPVTATVDPAGLNLVVTYNGGSLVPVVVGSYAVEASVDETNYIGSASATLTIEPSDQSISFPAIGAKPVDAAPFTISATASSGLPVTFSVVSGPAIMTGNQVELDNPSPGDTVVISASQAGNANWNAAPAVQQSFQVVEGDADNIAAASSTSIPGQAGEPITAGDLPTVQVTDSLGNPVAGVTVSFSIASGGGSVSGATQVTDGGGLAQVGGWTLGSAGIQLLDASAPGLSGNPVVFTAHVPLLAIGPTSLDFGPVGILDDATTSFTVSNTGSAASSLELTGVSLSGNSQFAITGSGNCAISNVLAGGEACSIEVTFDPDAVAGFSGSLDITSDAGDLSAALSGEGRLPDWADGFDGLFDETDWQFWALDGSSTLYQPTVEIIDDYLQISDPAAIYAGAYIPRSFGDSRVAALVNADGTGDSGLDNQIDQGVISHFDPEAMQGYAAYINYELDYQDLVLIKFDADNLDPALIDQRIRVAESSDGDWSMGRLYVVELDVVDQGGNALLVARAFDADTGTLLARVEATDTAPFGSGYTGVTAIANASGLNGTFDAALCASSFASLSVSETLVDFGQIEAFTDSLPVTIDISNPGNTELTISSLSLTGADAGQFSLDNGSCAAPVTAGASCSIDLAFSPDGVGPRSAQLVIESNASTNPDVVLLDGEGTPSGATVSLSNLVQTYDGSPKPVTVTTNPPGLSVTVTYDGFETVPVDAGSYAVEASTDDPAFPGTASATLTIEAADQTIAFPAIADRSVDDLPFTISASAGSGLTVSFSVVSGPATISGNEVTLVGTPGQVVIAADQAGDNNWNAAPTVQQSFQVIEGNPATIEAASATTINGQAGQPIAAGDLPTVLVTDSQSNPVAGVTVSFAVTSGGGSVSGATQVTDGSGLAQVGGWTLGGADIQTLEATAPGLSGSPVVFTANADADYLFVVSVDDSRDTIEAGERNTYIIVVTNTGSSDALGAQVSAALPAELDTSTADWVCAPSPQASCGGPGIGDLSDVADLPSGSSVVYVLEADVLAGHTQTIVLTATVELGDSSASGSDTTSLVINDDVIFTDRFKAAESGSSIHFDSARSQAGVWLQFANPLTGSHPPQLILRGENAGQDVFRIRALRTPQGLFIRLSVRDTDDQWQHATWQPITAPERLLAVDYDATTGTLLVTGEQLLAGLLGHTPTQPVKRLTAAPGITLQPAN